MRLQAQHLFCLELWQYPSPALSPVPLLGADLTPSSVFFGIFWGVELSNPQLAPCVITDTAIGCNETTNFKIQHPTQLRYKLTLECVILSRLNSPPSKCNETKRVILHPSKCITCLFLQFTEWIKNEGIECVVAVQWHKPAQGTIALPCLS